MSSRGATERAFPAYGPVDAVLGYALFYVVVDRVTLTVADVLTDALPGVARSAVGFGLAAFLWFVLAVTVVDQGRRQLAALGVLGADRSSDWRWAARVDTWTVLAAALAGSLVAAATFERALDYVPVAIRAVAALDVGPLLTAEFGLLVVFSVAYAVATRAADRLVIDGVRSLLVG